MFVFLLVLAALGLFLIMFIIAVNILAPINETLNVSSVVLTIGDALSEPGWEYVPKSEKDKVADSHVNAGRGMQFTLDGNTHAGIYGVMIDPYRKALSREEHRYLSKKVAEAYALRLSQKNVAVETDETLN